MKKIFSVLVILIFSSCSTVTLNPKGQVKLDSDPTYQERYPFFLMGLIGERDVNVKEICGNRSVKQIQTQNTFMDSFLGIVTLTIYTPRTLKVWCDEGKI